MAILIHLNQTYSYQQPTTFYTRKNQYNFTKPVNIQILVYFLIRILAISFIKLTYCRANNPLNTNIQLAIPFP